MLFRCGHCKALAPIYEQLAQIFNKEKDVIIAELDATEYKGIANKYDIKGYPTIKMFLPYQKSSPIEYPGKRDLESLVEYVNTQCGKLRDQSGLLQEPAGHIKAIDEVLSDGKYDKAKLNQVKDIVKDLPEDEKEYGEIYVKILKNVIKKGYEYLLPEYNRISKIIENGQMKPRKIGEFEYKKNILKEFMKHQD